MNEQKAIEIVLAKIKEVLAKRGGTNLPLVVGLSVAHVATLSIVFALMM